MHPTNPSLSHQSAGSPRPEQAKSPLIWGHEQQDRQGKWKRRSSQGTEVENPRAEWQERMAQKHGKEAQSTQGDPDVA